MNPDPLLSTAQVGDLFRVHPSTVKRWCDAGDLPSHRTEGGHRRIHLSDALRKASADGTDLPLAAFGAAAGAVWIAERRAVEKKDFEPSRVLAEQWLHERRFEELQDLVVHLGGLDPRLRPLLLDGMIREIMRGVGHRWQEGHLGAGGEHLATETFLEALFELRHRTADAERLPADAPVALVGCTEGERHCLGSHGIRLLLEDRGWKVRFAGPDLPLEEWSRLQASYAADLVCISFSAQRARADLLRAVQRLGVSYDPAHPYALAVGGGIAAGEGDLPEKLPFETAGVFAGAADFVAWLDGRSG